jgi:hypothetical protein
MRMRRRKHREPDFPGNELEQVLVLAAETGDDAKFLRALARSVVCLGQPADTPGAKPPGAGPAFLTVDVSQQPLPVAEGKDGKPVLLAFSSGQMLFRWYTEDPNQVWVQTPAGPLFDSLPEDMSVYLNPNGPLPVLIPPVDVRRVVDIFLGRNVVEAYRPGPATELRIGTPAHEPVDLLAAVSRAAARHPGVMSAHRGLAMLDEPDSRLWPIIGVRFADGCDDATVHSAMADLRDETEAVTEEFVELLRIPPSPSGVQRWLSESEPFYTAG